MKITVCIMITLLCAPLFGASSSHERTPLVKKVVTQKEIIDNIEKAAFALYLGESWEYTTSTLDPRAKMILNAYWQRGNANPCAREALLKLQAKALVENWEKVYIDTINDLIIKADTCSRCS